MKPGDLRDSRFAVVAFQPVEEPLSRLGGAGVYPRGHRPCKLFNSATRTKAARSERAAFVHRVIFYK
jgi:hypothetical protein